MILFERLRRDAAADWADYVRHPFVRGLADGSLPDAAFRRYLVQDTLFLVQFARAAALAAYKSDTLDDLREAAATLSGLLDVEMPLHLAFCARWGLDEARLAAEPEALETIAYTRYVQERGLAGDRLDLETALAPCVIGYREIGSRLAAGGVASDHPYREWIDTYAGAEYGAVAAASGRTLDRLWASRGGEGRYPGLLATFRQATRLETAFWSMGFVAGAATL